MADEVRSGRRRYRYDEIVEQLQEMIRSGALGVGEKIPPERTLAETFKVSRNCIRQAVQALAEKHLLESRQGDGTYVRAPDPVLLANAFAQAVQVQKETLREIIEFRLMLEPQIAWLAARRITPSELDRLKIIVCDQQRKVLAGETDAALDAAFHLHLADATGNRVIQKVAHTLSEILNESRSESLQSEERSRASLMGHFKILDALEQHDSEMALQAMKEHLLAVERVLLGISEERAADLKGES